MSDEFPVLCATCIGPDPYVRMIREAQKSECRECGRPFVVHRWSAATGASAARGDPRGRVMRKSEICRACSTLRGCCQSCLSSLDTGLSNTVAQGSLAADESGTGRLAALRDAVSSANRDYQLADIERAAERAQGARGTDVSRGGAAVARGGAVNEAAGPGAAGKGTGARHGRGRVCEDWMRGECARGARCPRSHSTDGVPESLLLRTLHVIGSLGNSAEKTIRSHFGPEGVTRVSLRGGARAFVEFATRARAEAAMLENGHGVRIAGQHVKVVWARSNNAGKGDNPGRQQGPAGQGPTKSGRSGPFGPAVPRKPRANPTALFPTYDATDPSNL